MYVCMYVFRVADLAALAGDTHKFESRYLDSLVGKYPEAVRVYILNFVVGGWVGVSSD